VEFTTADGDVLLLTARSAYKLSDPTRKNADGSRSRNRSDYNATKYRAAGHIDELISIADNKRFVPDDGSHKNDIGEDGFDYRQVYFQDYDGKHYQMDLSVAKNGAENTVYSIGDIKERSFPPNTGPSSKTGGAPEGEKASDNANIAQPEDLVKHSSSGSFDTGIGDVLKKAMDKSKGAVTGGQLSVDLGENDLLRASTGRTADEINADIKSNVDQYSAMRENKQPGVREAAYPHETAHGKTMHTAQTIGGSNLVDDRMELDVKEAILAGK